LKAQQQAEYDALPVPKEVSNEAILNRRSELMAQQSNTKDEARRQMNLRMADFFAHWGSTPGPVLQAGLQALTQTMPGLLEDKKDQEKLTRELSQAKFDLDWADHMEQKGDQEAAQARRDKVAHNLQHTEELQAAAYHNFDLKMAEQAAQTGRSITEQNVEVYKARLGAQTKVRDFGQNDNQVQGTFTDIEKAVNDRIEKDYPDWEDLTPEQKAETRKQLKKEIRKERGLLSAEEGGTPDVSKYVDKYKLSPADARSYMDWEASQRGG
jgi:hypothetical protein